MPTHKSRLTKTQDQEYRARLSRLEEIGIPIGCAEDPSLEPDRLILEQIQHDFARLHELPAGAVAVVVPVRMTVLTSGILIRGLGLMTGLDDDPLDVSDPEGWPSYEDVIDWFPFSPKVLNHRLTNGVPLRHCQVEGVIIANGWSAVPPQWHDEALVKVELLFTDERRHEMSFVFGVRVDRSLKRQYERRQRERRERTPLTRPRGGLYDGGQLADPKSVSPMGDTKPRRHEEVALKKPD